MHRAALVRSWSCGKKPLFPKEWDVIISLCPQWVGPKFQAVSKRSRLYFTKKLQAAECCHRVIWKDGGTASPQSVRPASGIRRQRKGVTSRSLPLVPIHPEVVFSTSFSLTAEVRRHMADEAGIGRRGKEPLAAECGHRERHSFPACAMELLQGATGVL